MRLAAAVHETLSPFMSEMREGLESVRKEMREGVAGNKNEVLSRIEEKVDSLSRDLEEHKNKTTTELAGTNSNLLAVNTSMSEGLMAVNTSMSEGLSAVNTSMSEGLSAVNTSMSEGLSEVKTELEEHSSQTSSELAGLEANQETLDSKLDSLDTKQDTLSSTVTTLTSELEHTVITNVTEELKKTADYILEHVPTYECGGSGGWRRVVYLNMTDPNTNCPSSWNLTSHTVRTCGKVSTSRLSCDSAFFPVSGDYTSVCGSIRAYQNSQTDAFEAYHVGDVTTIEGPYVSGVSLTHGSPRQHIWTFAAAATETRTNAEGCPCTGASVTIPPFVGGDYFCESGVNSGSLQSRFYPDNPLWDGQDCSSNSTCCSFNNPPYFTKQLPSPTSDPIEARLCRWESDDDSPVEFMELYVK